MYLLDFDKTYPYIIDHLKNGHSLAQQISTNIDFRKGKFFTLLPNNAVLNRIYLYHQGGILPSLGRLETARYANFWPIPNTDQQLIEFIYAYFLEHNSHELIIDHVIARTSDLHLDIKGTDLITYNKEVYYVMTSSTAYPELIQELIETTGQAWYFLAVLTNHTLRKEIDNKAWKTICAHITYVIIGAYDGEGYIFWQREEG